MREIKYRAWDKVNNKMQYSGIIWGDYNFPILSGLNYGNDINNLSNLMQYTGLKDKNGTEIYEGDIIGDTEDWSIVIWCDKCIGWQLAWYDYDIDEKTCHMCDGNFDITETFENNIADNNEEVIGNIYESKHLLDNTELLTKQSEVLNMKGGEEVEEIPVMKGTREALNKIVI